MYIPSQYVLIQQEISQFSLNLVSLSCVNVLNVFLTTGVLTGRREFTEIGVLSDSISNFWPHTKLPLDSIKQENNSLLPQENTKEIIINHKETRMAKDGDDET